ncbi:MAG: OsmC family protein [Anaerolineae bacterium]|nr:OsmC family protein [Anaerolineae bacterium]MCO5193651.1 OsmC family protein [Anaerolineae bacterium]MCO5206523.1 OsmC family protein [Anaerolineae bacterium]
MKNLNKSVWLICLLVLSLVVVACGGDTAEADVAAPTADIAETVAEEVAEPVADVAEAADAEAVIEEAAAEPDDSASDEGEEAADNGDDGTNTAQTAAQELATAKASAQLSNQRGRAIVSARGNHFIVDSVPPLEGPNEELNPLDMLLGSLATCGIFVAEKAAQEQGFPLADATATVQGDLDPTGVAGSGTDPRIQIFRVRMDLDGLDAEQSALMVDEFKARCPIYTTLSRSADVEITVGDAEQSAPIDGLTTATASAQLSNQPGRAIVSARGNHFIIDSVPPLEGPNEERNPLDLILGSLATCGSFIFERVAEEQTLSLTDIVTEVEADFDPSGVAGADVNPRIQTLRVNITVNGISQEQANMMVEQFEQRCPIYTTLSRSAPIDVSLTVAE